MATNGYLGTAMKQAIVYAAQSPAKRVAPTYKGFKAASRASSRAMRANRSAGTKPEVLLERLVRRLGLRGRRNVAELPGKPDLVFARARVVVFCDGDFWHGRHWSVLK